LFIELTRELLAILASSGTILNTSKVPDEARFAISSLVSSEKYSANYRVFKEFTVCSEKMSRFPCALVRALVEPLKSYVTTKTVHGLEHQVGDKLVNERYTTRTLQLCSKVSHTFFEE
jgi:hypothetical protein